MKYLLLLPLLLCSCASPGITIYGDPVQKVAKDGAMTSFAPKLMTINADVIGDVEVPNRFRLSTAKDGAGNFAYTEVPVVMKDGTVVITRQPMVAQIKTASVWDAMFSGLAKNLNAVGQWAATAIGLGAVAQPVAGAVGGAIP